MDVKACGSSELQNGDIVIHPNRPWPWVGLVQGKLGNNNVCPCCGKAGLQHPSFPYQIPVEAKPSEINIHSKVNNVEVDILVMQQQDEQIDEIANAKDVKAVLNHICIENESQGTCDCDHDWIEPCSQCCDSSEMDGDLSNDVMVIDETKNNELNCKQTQTTGTQEPNWTIVWHPTLETSSPDHTEHVICSSRKRYYQDGQSVQRPNTTRKGIIKGVMQNIDALVLPDCKYVVTGLVNSSRFDTVQDLETATAGRYIIYKGWLAAVYGLWYRVYFKMEDGTEFSVADNDQDMSLHCIECLVTGRQVPVESFQMFPGMKVKAPHLLLDKANWLTSGYELSESLKKIVAASKAEWDVKQQAVDDYWTVDSPKRKTGAPIDSQPTSSSNKEEMVEKMEEEKIEITDEKNEKEKLELLLTVTRVEPIKMEVEWRCVVSGAEIQPEFTCLDEKQIDQAQHFRVPVSFLAYKGMGSRFRYELKSNDKVISVEQWRNDRLFDKVQLPPISIDNDHYIPKNNDVVYLYQLTSDCFVDILWEDGEAEKAVASDQLIHSTCLDAGRDYFPAMYVLLETKGVPEGLCAESKDKFGLVLKSNNLEKFSQVQWYRSVFDSDGNKCKGVEPIALEIEEMSFYDLRSHPDYNYLTGTLVAKYIWEHNDRPNLGYVLQKLPGGTVAVRWYGEDFDSVEKPWDLYKLKVNPDYQETIYTGSEHDPAGQYSPTEHEWDELEDFRYYEYTNISEPERWQRIGLLAELMAPCLALLQRLLLIVHRQYPLLDRRQIVRLALHCDDVISGFSVLSRFKEPIEKLYRERAGMDSQTNQHQQDLHQPVAYGLSNWMYDWNEVTAELTAAVNKQSTKKKNKQTNDTVLEQNSSQVNESSQKSDNIPMECEPSNNIIPLSLILDWINSIQTAFTTVSQVLTQTQLPEMTVSLVVDCVQSIQQLVTNSAQFVDSDEPNADAPPTDEELQLALRFVKCFQKNSKKVGRLPCFSYCMPPETELAALADEWNVVTLSDSDGAIVQASAGPKPIKQSVSEMMRRVVTRIDSMQEDGSKFSSDEIVPLIQELADALSLSCVVTLRVVIEHIRNDLDSFSKQLLVGQSSKRDSESNEMDLIEGQPTKRSDSVVDDSEGDVLCPSSFQIIEEASTTHRFIAKSFDVSLMPKAFMTAVRKELKLLRASLPHGIVVKTFENRLDLFSCMIVGPEGTPYAHGVFCFDVRLKEDYPTRPPHVFFKSMSKRLNPNLYEDGMVCLSLLGTWDGKATELWTAHSTLLQVFLSIQSLVLVPEPYYNEPGYEKDKGTEASTKKSREYNESAILLSLESLVRTVSKPPEPFVSEIKRHFIDNAPRLLKLLERYQTEHENMPFPLYPVTQGFCLCIKRHMENITVLWNRLRAESVD